MISDRELWMELGRVEFVAVLNHSPIAKTRRD